MLYHKHVQKTPEEVAQLRKESSRRESLKAMRKAEQKRNVEGKAAAEQVRRVRVDV